MPIDTLSELIYSSCSNVILGGKKLISLMLLLRCPIIFSPHHNPARNVIAVKNKIATISTSTVWLNHVGNELIKSNSDSSIMLA